MAFIHPAELPGPTVDGIPPFAADFLLDTIRAAFLLVRNGIRARYPNIKFILSHAGGFVPPVAVQYFTATGDAYTDADHAAINRGNALPLFPRLARS